MRTNAAFKPLFAINHSAGAPKIDNGVPLVAMLAVTDLRAITDASQIMALIDRTPEHVIEHLVGIVMARPRLFHRDIVRSFLQTIGHRRCVRIAGTTAANAAWVFYNLE